MPTQPALEISVSPTAGFSAADAAIGEQAKDGPAAAAAPARIGEMTGQRIEAARTGRPLRPPGAPT